MIFYRKIYYIENLKIVKMFNILIIDFFEEIWNRRCNLRVIGENLFKFLTRFGKKKRVYILINELN